MSPCAKSGPTNTISRGRSRKKETRIGRKGKVIKWHGKYQIEKSAILKIKFKYQRVSLSYKPSRQREKRKEKRVVLLTYRD